ncbi:TRAP transporter small permease [Thiogranum longum]
MNLLKQFRYGLIQLESWMAAASLFLLLALAIAQIVARNFFDAGIPDADTLTRYLVLYVTFFGAAVAVDRDRHIRIDIGCALLSPAILRVLYRPMRLIAALVCAFLGSAAIRFWRDEWLYAPEHEHWQVIAGLIIPVGFILLAVQFLVTAVLGRDEASCSTR